MLFILPSAYYGVVRKPNWPFISYSMFSTDSLPKRQYYGLFFVDPRGEAKPVPRNLLWPMDEERLRLRVIAAIGSRDGKKLDNLMVYYSARAVEAIKNPKLKLHGFNSLELRHYSLEEIELERGSILKKNAYEVIDRRELPIEGL